VKIKGDGYFKLSPSGLRQLERRLLHDSCRVVEARVKLEHRTLNHGTQILVRCRTDINSPFVRVEPDVHSHGRLGLTRLQARIQKDEMRFKDSLVSRGILYLLACLFTEPERNGPVNNWKADLHVLEPFTLLQEFSQRSVSDQAQITRSPHEGMTQEQGWCVKQEQKEQLVGASEVESLRVRERERERTQSERSRSTLGPSMAAAATAREER
jgi:hypothetical protein